MRRRALVGIFATLGLVALVGLFASLSLLFSSPSPAYAQGTNSEPEFLDDNGDAITDTIRNVNENTAAYDNIGPEVEAFDDDDDRLTYSIRNARTSPFTIVRATGQLQVGQPLDYETKSSYEVTVLVTDGKDDDDNVETHPVTDNTITVTITVNNVDDSGKVSLTWTKLLVGIEVTATLTDSDGGVTGTTWQWESSNTSSSGYTNISGATSATYTPHTANRYVRVVASYTDDQGASKTARSAAAYVKNPPTQGSNKAPAFDVNTQGGYSCSNNEATVCLYVKRNASPGSDIYYPARATDPDTQDQIHYSLGDTDDDDLFRIDKFSGELFTTYAHAYNSPGSDGKFEITITATDPHTAAVSITAALRPSGGANSPAPAVTGPEVIRYPENGTWPLAIYSASIDGRGIGEDIGWIIGVEPGGGDGDFFDIDHDGNLTFTQPPDYENPADYPYIEGEDGDNSYSFSLHVYDSNPTGGRPGATFFPVTVIVEDVIVEALEIDGPSAVDYAEDRTDAVATYTLQGGSGTVKWVLSGRDGGEFSINTNGELAFNTPPDYENPTDAPEENAYLVTITAYKDDEAKTEFVRVRVTDVNEPPEFDEGTTANRSVDRSTSVNQVFGDPVKATDPDKNDGLTYALENAHLFPFDIEPYTGHLYVSEALDDAQSSYTVSVSVTDGADEEDISDTTVDARITVTISLDSDNTAPEFPSTEDGARSIAENPTGVVDVGTPVAATDGDSHTLSYSLGGTDASSFDIVDTNGQIQTKTGQNYDFETKPSYSVTVTADDSNGGTADKDVTISLTNVDEDGTVTLSTSQPVARTQLTATLTDQDSPVTSTTWVWAHSDAQDGTYTDISGATLATYTPADGDVGEFLKATASYTDSHGPGKTAEAVSANAVGSGANRQPTFNDDLTTTREVAENTEAGESAGDLVEATDLDNDSLTYSLIGTDAGSFTVDNTGQIKVGTSTTLDYEAARNSYTVIVQVRDSKDAGGTADTTTDDTIVVTINVTNVDEDGTVSLSMTQPSARTQLTATLTDPDGGVTGESVAVGQG